MSTTLNKAKLFPPELVPELLDMSKGKSALARLSNAKPLPFNGTTSFTFNMDKGINVVDEGGAHAAGGVTIAPVTITPIKVEYGTRVSDEFVYGAKEVRLEYMRAFMDGFAKKLAEGLDLMAVHGWNPRTNAASDVIGQNHFDAKVTGNVVTTGSADADTDIESAIQMVNAAGFDVSGLFLSNQMKSELSKLRVNGKDGPRLYPDLAWGNEPGVINGLHTESNLNMSANSSLDRALLGDFQNYFRWGISKKIPMKIIDCGCPDNDAEAGDLQGHDQVYVRAIAYLGWGILAPEAFALVKATV